ncbi:uncharacterized protein B4U79_10587 [Dinothrombium tinctorium]|uniref:RNA-binding motif protein, X-linked 2 n=1 Tax=Dinothrombium tinctorium TaxID=1965070 RepID=A0A443RJB1_9ACAR|nr:uncharacterized protein B4U79_10587 [Dinothrombium tinctorium]
MNPLTNVKNIKKLSENELKLGISEKSSWHNLYKHSAWIFVGGLHYDLTEGDIICVFSQYGEVVNINLIRDKKTGKSKGYCFLCYEDQRSTILAVDNLNGIKLTGRVIRVDHVDNYRPPKDDPHSDEYTKRLREEGCAPKELITNIKKERDHDKSKLKKERAHSSDSDYDYEQKKESKKEKHSRHRSRETHSHEKKDKKRSSHRSRTRTRSRSRSRSRTPSRSDHKHKRKYN